MLLAKIRDFRVLLPHFFPQKHIKEPFSVSTDKQIVREVSFSDIWLPLLDSSRPNRWLILAIINHFAHLLVGLVRLSDSLVIVHHLRWF